MPEYTVLAVVAVCVVLAGERWWFRTGLLRTKAYWVAMAIVCFFQVLMDGWLTYGSTPIVWYDADEITGWRVPWDIPVEDYLFGFALVTSALLLWVRSERDSGT